MSSSTGSDMRPAAGDKGSNRGLLVIERTLGTAIHLSIHPPDTYYFHIAAPSSICCAKCSSAEQDCCCHSITTSAALFWATPSVGAGTAAPPTRLKRANMAACVISFSKTLPIHGRACPCACVTVGPESGTVSPHSTRQNGGGGLPSTSSSWWLWEQHHAASSCWCWHAWGCLCCSATAAAVAAALNYKTCRRILPVLPPAQPPAKAVEVTFLNLCSLLTAPCAVGQTCTSLVTSLLANTGCISPQTCNHHILWWARWI